MADLVSHACLALVVKRGQRAVLPGRPLHLASFTTGAVLPDLLGRLPASLFGRMAARVEVPPVLLHGWEPFHLPSGMLLSAVALSALFRSDQRRAVLGNLLGGMALHLAVDLLQDHAGGGYLLLFPFSTTPYELGWLSTEATTWWAPVLVLVTVLAWHHALASLTAPPPAGTCRGTPGRPP